MDKKYVLITGTSTGIGRATALHLDKLGFHVFAGVRKESDGGALHQEASERLQPVILDVTKPEHIEAVKQLITDTVGDTGLYGLINNAGVAVPAPVELLPLDDLRWVLEVNLIGGIALIQALMPQIRKAKGRIITVSSVGGRVSAMMNSAYSMSKFAIEAMMDALRQEVQKWGIEVISIQPGAIDTPIWKQPS